MDSIEKYALFSGHSYDKSDQGAAHSANVTMITGTAMSDSTDGVVSVDLGGNTISANDEQAVDISTTCAVKAGDVVQVSVIGADGTAKSLLVTGVIAGGDRMQADVETAKDVAQSANQTANTTKIYFYSDESGAHVRNQNSTSAGTRADIKSDGLHVIDQDDGRELASFTSSGASIGKDSEMHSRYSSDGVRFYEGGKSYPFSQIKPVTYKNEKYSAAVFTTAPDDISTDDGLYHSGATVDVTAINGTATDNTGVGRVTLTATTVQSADPKEAYIDIFASNDNPNKASGGKTVEDTYINLVAEGIYFNSKPLIDYFYPVGAIYISTKVTSPASLFGGSWEQIQDRFLLAAGSTYGAGTTGGEATHTLTQSELPKIIGDIWNVAYQDSGITCLAATGVFSPLKRNEGHGAGTYVSNNGYDGFSMSFGDDKPHNNMPPYRAVYMWRRIA